MQAALCFPSFPRFAGTVFLKASDKELALLCVQAWNDFMIDEWCASAPDRFIPIVIMPLWDPALCVAELERTAAKGARAISFLENPVPLGLPSYHTDHWDGFFSAVRSRRHSDLPALRLVRPVAVDRAGGAVRGDYHPVRLQLDVRHGGPAVLAGLSPAPESEGGHGRRGHRVGSLSARARRLRVEPASLLPERRPEHVAVGAVRQAHLRAASSTTCTV